MRGWSKTLELRTLTEQLKIGKQVTFLRSFTDEEKVALLDQCTAMLYTPSNEHFGICPLEGMYMRNPVIAANSGGPLETVLHGKTGFLCEPTAESFAEQMLHLVRNPSVVRKMGEAGHSHVVENFSFHAFTEKLDSIVASLTE